MIRVKAIEVTVKLKGNITGLTYEVRKTEKGAMSFANRLANSFFWGEEVDIELKEMEKK